MRQPIQVAVYPVRIVDKNWEYLMLRRIPSGGSIWQGITGGVEDDEEYITTACRELKEETQFDPVELHLINYSYTFPVEESMRKLYKQKVDLINEIVFLAIVEPDKEPILSNIEHDKYIWCGFDKAYEMLFWRGNKESLIHCQSFLKSKFGR